MNLNELKNLCKKSLELYYDLKILELKGAKKRTVLPSRNSILLNSKQAQLDAVKNQIMQYDFLFDTTVKELRDVILNEVATNPNMYLSLNSVKSSHKNIKNEQGIQENCLVNSFELLLCRRYYNISILKFESQDDILIADKTKINLLKEGFIRACGFDPRVEELELQIPGFQNLMWNIVENNMMKNNNESLDGKSNIAEKN